MAKPVSKHTKNFQPYLSRTTGYIYLAESDGILILSGTCDSGEYIQVDTGVSILPPTYITLKQTSGSSSANLNLTVPVRKNEFYEIKTTGSSVEGYWFPIK